MNPRLIKFAVELQIGDKSENLDTEKKYISFKDNKKNILGLCNSSFITVPIEEK